MNCRWLPRLTVLAMVPLTGTLALAEWPETPSEPVDRLSEIGLPPPPGAHPHHPRSDGGSPQFPAPRGALLVDCSGSHRHMFRSVNAAVRHARPGSSVLIIPPGLGGATCRETVHVGKPLTIASYGGGRDAVIQAPPQGACLRADIALGDALVIDGIRFIARNPHSSCVMVRAGHVVVRNSQIDSRSSAWAFNVGDSVQLTVQDSHIETDGSGIYADRAHLELSNVTIDLEGGDKGIGLSLHRTDGQIEDGGIIGGATAILASSGNRDLRFTGTKIRKAMTGVAIETGGLGTVFVNRLNIDQSRFGIVIKPHTDADVTDNIITEVREAGITAEPHAKTRIDGNTITAIRHGACIVGRPPDGNHCHDDGPPPPRPNLLQRIFHYVFGG